MKRAPLLLVCLLLLTTQAHAWDKHESLMPWVLSSLPADVRAKLEKPIQAPCPEDDARIYHELQTRLLLNPDLDLAQMKLKATADNCAKPTSALEILSRGFVDDPDQGMDKNLPDSMAAQADPDNERQWMGGKAGPSSQGFRHMYFGGWKLRRPIETFQIPTHAIGQAPNRTQAMADEAKRLFAASQTAWGWRVLSWQLHYAQDLTQPFHAVQLPSARMIRLEALLANLGNFGAFIKDMTRILTNYHWAYEGLVLQELRLGEKSPLAECLKDFERETNLGLPATGSAKDNAFAVAQGSVKNGSAVGHGVMGAFGTILKDSSSDLTQNRGTPDYAALAVSATPEVRALNRATCRALSNAIVISRQIITEAATAQP